LKELKTQFQVFKNSENILGIDNDVIYQHTKSQPKIPYIIVLTEMIKYDIIWRFEIMHFLLNINIA
jgi:hypothetical protein